MYIKHFLYTIICFFVITNCLSQNSESITRAFLEQSANRNNLNSEDIKDWVITGENKSNASKIHHIYGTQQFNGIEIYGATFGLHLINDDEVVKFNTNFISGLSQKAQLTKASPTISAVKAVEFAIDQLNLSNSKAITIVKRPSGKTLNQIISAPGISNEEIPAKLMYFQNDAGALVLVWDVGIGESDGKNYWSLKIDATTGKILDKINLVISCSFGAHTNTAPEKENHNTTIKEADEFISLAGGYNVYPMPVESPLNGGRSLVTNPDNAIASPYGWHDTNGSSGAEFTITRGNNVFAYDDDDNNNLPGFSPNGGGSLTFNFPINTTYSPADQSEAAVITNLFYWNNIIHDVWYQYGFDEASGNFQENNYGKGGVGGDSVNAEAQDGSGTCNANFRTLTEGSNPRMQMYVCRSRDGDIDNGVIVHEYGHGISTRLVGGPNNVSSLRNQEQMGEGWSDWFATMMTIEPGDQGADLRPIGNWLLGNGINGPGIRTYPYSTNMTVSQYTYDDIKTFSVPHGVGSVWASMLWEMTWELINEYGFDPNLYTGNGGNNIAMQLVIEGLKLTPSSPGFIDGRDAILQADQILYNGANQCFIWKSFARRGLGVSAAQGSSGSRSDGTEAFDIPDCDDCPNNLTITTNVNSGQTDIQKAANTLTAKNTIANGAIATYTAGQRVVFTAGFKASNGSRLVAKIEDCNVNVTGTIAGLATERVQIKSVSKTSEIADKGHFVLHPNPTDGAFTISANHLLSKGNISLRIYNMLGAIQLQKESLNTTTKVDVKSLAEGLYYVVITDNTGKSHSKKLQIKR